MKKILALLFIVASATVFAQNNQDKPIDVPKIAIKIPLGETMSTHGYSITFLEVLEDSRCPTNVTCVWAGRVKVKIKIEKKSMQPIEEMVIFGTTTPKEEKNHIFFESEGIKLEGIKVTPYPKTEAEKQKKEYTLLLCAYTN